MRRASTLLLVLMETGNVSIWVQATSSASGPQRRGALSGFSRCQLRRGAGSLANLPPPKPTKCARPAREILSFDKSLFHGETQGGTGGPGFGALVPISLWQRMGAIVEMYGLILEPKTCNGSRRFQNRNTFQSSHCTVQRRENTYDKMNRRSQLRTEGIRVSTRGTDRPRSREENCLRQSNQALSQCPCCLGGPDITCGTNEHRPLATYFTRAMMCPTVI
jgi:hypothetical protein